MLPPSLVTGVKGILFISTLVQTQKSQNETAFRGLPSHLILLIPDNPTRSFYVEMARSVRLDFEYLEFLLGEFQLEHRLTKRGYPARRCSAHTRNGDARL